MSLNLLIISCKYDFFSKRRSFFTLPSVVKFDSWNYNLDMMEILLMTALHLLRLNQHRQNLLRPHLVNLIKIIITPGLVHILKHRVLILMAIRERQWGLL